MNYKSIKPLIHIQDVSQMYDEKYILSHISLNIYKGDISILRGPSGSGKSTFLRVLTGIDKPHSGDVFYDGTSIRDTEFYSFYREHIGIFFTDSVFFESSTTRENIMFPSLFGGYEYFPDIFSQCSKTLEIEHLMDTPVGRLSSGERERVALTRMLVSLPDILILDEPFSHLDERLYAIALSFLSEYIKTYHVTLLVVTHDRGFILDGAQEYRIEQGSLKHL